MLKKRLMTPGPTQVPEEALLTLARQVTHHRTPEFRAIFKNVLEGLKDVFQTAGEVVVLSSSGTGAMEAALVNSVARGQKIIVLDAGKFAERWMKIAQAYEINVVRLEIPWGQAAQPAKLAQLLAEHPDTAAVCGTLMESSTGVGHDIQKLAQVVRQSKALFIVDGTSGIGVMECRMDAWGVDIVTSGSQKAFMLPPGLSFVAAQPSAWQAMEKVKPQAFYFNLLAHRKQVLEGPDTPWTSAHTLVMALAETLKIIRASGMEHVWQRARTLSAATRAGIEGLGLSVFPERPAEGLTAASVPDTLDGSALLKQLESRFGIKLAGGQNQLKGKIFRIAHMGIVDELDILGTIGALELVLSSMGWPVEIGAGLAAANRVLAAGHSKA